MVIAPTVVYLATSRRDRRALPEMAQKAGSGRDGRSSVAATGCCVVGLAELLHAA